MDPGVQVRARSASFWCQTAPVKRGQDPFRGTQGRAPGRHRIPPERRGLQVKGGGDPRAGGLCNPGRSLESGADLLRLVQGVEFWRPTPSALLALGLRSHTDIPALKEFEEWFDSQKEIRNSETGSFFERTNKLASRRLKREIERRGTLGEFAQERIP